jgi:P27 family predicted phage terminase small subunit
VPLELADMPLAVAEWQRLAPVLRRQQQITEGDRNALIAGCLEWAKYIEAVKSSARDGAVLRGSRGRLRLNPQTSIAQKSLAALSRLWIPSANLMSRRCLCSE